MSVGQKDTSHDVGSSAAGRSESNFLTKGKAKQDKLLAKMRVRGPARSPNFQYCSRDLPFSSSFASGRGRRGGGEGFQ